MLHHRLYAVLFGQKVLEVLNGMRSEMFKVRKDTRGNLFALLTSFWAKFEFFDFRRQ
jgi:hypothetical protein